MTTPDCAEPGPFLGHLSPAATASPPWYKKQAHASSDVEDGDHDTDFDFLAGASTPLNVSKSVLFASPMKRLDKLHLSAAVPCIPEAEATADGDDEHDADDDAFLGNQTIITETDSDDDNDLLYSQPTYVPQRKRKHADTPDKHADSPDMHTTPSAHDHTIPHGSADMSGIMDCRSADSALRISFSASDSTPCPIQPRKRLKFKNPEELTPSQPSRVHRPLLNLSSSRKLSASNVPLLSKLATADNDDSLETSSDFSRSRGDASSTPISQSTPANSRAPSPAFVSEDLGDGINGYKFVHPDAKFKYQTPHSRPTSAYPHIQHNSSLLLRAYNSNDFGQLSAGKYKIVGAMPITAAGSMDENDDDLHVGDKRINDPYLVAPESLADDANQELRALYVGKSDKLPLLVHFERDLDNDEMDALINDGSSVWAFYTHIIGTDSDDLTMFLKKERLRWHPDKWNNRFADSCFVKSNIDNLSQVINGLIEHLQSGGN